MAAFSLSLAGACAAHASPNAWISSACLAGPARPTTELQRRRGDAAFGHARQFAWTLAGRGVRPVCPSWSPHAAPKSTRPCDGRAARRAAITCSAENDKGPRVESDTVFFGKIAVGTVALAVLIKEGGPRVFPTPDTYPPLPVVLLCFVFLPTLAAAAAAEVWWRKNMGPLEREEEERQRGR
eukprot:tig00000144_g9093.t1